MKKSKAQAIWKGNLKEGNGQVQLTSTGNRMGYNYGSRFEEGEGTNPEELIGAAHAGCFSMAFSMLLSEEGYTPKQVNTDAIVTLSKADEGFMISEIDLNTEASVPNIKEVEFLELAEKAKDSCPVSQALKAVKINMQAKLLP